MIYGHWRAGAIIPEDDWTVVPDNNHEEYADWPAEECARICQRFAESQGDASAEEIVSETLKLALSVRQPDTLLTLLHWPLPLPAASIVRVLIASDIPGTPHDWERHGFLVDECSGRHLGPGIKCVAERSECLGGETQSLLTAAYQFSREDGLGVIVVAESGVREIFQLTAGAMPTVLAGLRILQPDGEEFVGGPVRGISRMPIDEWEVPANA